MTRAVTFTQAQVRRAVKAAESAGLRVRRVTINPDGSITVEGGKTQFPALDVPNATLQRHGTTSDGQAVAVLKLKYVNEYRAGKLRRYFRRGSKRALLPGEVGSDEFMATYQACLAEDKPVATAKIAGSFGLLITEYYGSRAFRA